MYREGRDAYARCIARTKAESRSFSGLPYLGCREDGLESGFASLRMDLGRVSSITWKLDSRKALEHGCLILGIWSIPLNCHSSARCPPADPRHK